MNLSDFLPFVLPSAKGCADTVAEFQIRRAIIDLCTRALVWRADQDTITSTAETTTYAYLPATGQQVIKLLSVTLDGCRVEVVDPTVAGNLEDRGATRSWALGTFSGFELHPEHDAGLDIITFSAVAPASSADEVPDSFERYAEEIGRGALYRLLATVGQDYSNPKMAADLRAQWDNVDIPKARTDAFKGFARTNPRARGSFF